MDLSKRQITGDETFRRAAPDFFAGSPKAIVTETATLEEQIRKGWDDDNVAWKILQDLVAAWVRTTARASNHRKERVDEIVAYAQGVFDRDDGRSTGLELTQEVRRIMEAAGLKP